MTTLGTQIGAEGVTRRTAELFSQHVARMASKRGEP
jgi:hypothetical protein